MNGMELARLNDKRGPYFLLAWLLAITSFVEKTID